MAKRILVVDDDPQIVRLVRAYLEQSGYEVLTAYDGPSAIVLWRTERPDLVVLDLMLPGRDGLDVTRTIRSEDGLGTPIIMLTARIEDQDKVLGLELGADDYVTKPFNPRELVARVRAVLRRSQGGPVSQVLQVGDLRIDIERHEAYLDGEPVRLTPTEFSLLQVLAENPGRVMRRHELIEAARGYGYEGLERTVDSHIKNLRQNLSRVGGEDLGKELIETVFGIGYRLYCPPEAVPSGKDERA